MSRLAFVYTLLLFSCSPSYRIVTQPAGSDVFSGDTLLGQTPLEVSAAKINMKTGKGVLVRVEKDGYKAVWVWLPDTFHDYIFSLNLTPFYLRNDGDEQAITDEQTARLDLYRVTHNLLELQTRLLYGASDELENLPLISKANPALGSIHFLNALRLLREGKDKESLVQLQEAMRFAPEEPDFLDLYNEMKLRASGGDPETPERDSTL